MTRSCPALPARFSPATTTNSCVTRSLQLFVFTSSCTVWAAWSQFNTSLLLFSAITTQIQPSCKCVYWTVYVGMLTSWLRFPENVASVALKCQASPFSVPNHVKYEVSGSFPLGQCSLLVQWQLKLTFPGVSVCELSLNESGLSWINHVKWVNALNK